MSADWIQAREPRRTGSSTVIVDTSPDAIARHLEDAAHYPGGHADGVARPRTEAEVASLVTSATRVLPVGAQSSVTGGATPSGGLVLSTERLRSIQESGQSRVRVEAGVPLDVLQKMLSADGRWYAPVPTFTGAFAGGVVATNAAGAATFKYGPTRPWVDGLTVVLACGCVIDVNRGEQVARDREPFHLRCLHGDRQIPRATYQLPDVPKCSAGYFAAPDLDLIDLFIGSEGTLGVIVDATFRVMAARPPLALALVPVPTERAGLALVGDLRAASRATWQSGDAEGLDVAAIEHLDRRCLEILREDGAGAKQAITVPDTAALVLIVQLELAAGMTAARAYEDVASAFAAADGGPALARFCRLLRRHGVFDHTELAMPGDERRAAQFLPFREAAPTGVNRRVGDAKRAVDPRIEKTAADMIVPIPRFADMMSIYRAGYERRGLDYAIWGHISDGNVHPNVIPRSFADVEAGRDAILEFGLEVTRLGGSPLAEHGVGRSAIKQALLRQLYGDRAIDEMQAIKRALDPDWKLSPGVLFPVER
jgi:D-lactate dehydrogenase (cytochrome)